MAAQRFNSASQSDMFARTDRKVAEQRRSPLTPQQRAMAERPTATDLRRSAETWRAPPQERMVKHRQVEVGGWTCRVYNSPYAAGLLLVTADRARQALSEEVRDQAEADAWIDECTRL